MRETLIEDIPYINCDDADLWRMCFSSTMTCDEMTTYMKDFTFLIDGIEYVMSPAAITYKAINSAYYQCVVSVYPGGDQ